MVVITICILECRSLLLFSCFTDINECELETHDCEQQCFNSIGSYNCGCNEGCELSDNENSCNGN